MTPLHAPDAFPSGTAVCTQVAGRTVLEEAARSGMLYAVLDACDDPDVLNKVTELGTGRAVSLYAGRIAESFREEAPYLAQVDVMLLSWILETRIHFPWGLFIQSRLTLKALRNQLRRFLHVLAPTGDVWQFRFYDPRVLPGFLRHAKPGEACELFVGVESFVVSSDGVIGEAFKLTQEGEAAHPRRRGVGELFRLRDAHVGALRRERIGDALIESFKSPSQYALRDDRDSAVLLVRGRRPGEMRIELDVHGFIGAALSPRGRRWQMENDAAGRLLQMITPSGEVRRLSYHKSGQLEKFHRADVPMMRATYDGCDRLERVCYPDDTHVQLCYRYDSTEARVLANPLARQIHQLTNRLGHRVSFTHDEHHDLTAIIDGNGHRTCFEYGEWKRPNRVTLPDGSVDSYEFDNSGRPGAIVFNGGNRLEFEHDPQGRLRSLCGSDGGGASFRYDDQGRMMEAVQGESVVRYGYDPDGRIVLEEQNGEVVRWHFDEDGVLTTLILPEGETVCYERDADLELASITGWSGERIEFRSAPDQCSGMMLLPNGLVENTWRSRSGLPLRSCVGYSDTTPLFSVERTFDQEDRLVLQRDSRLGELQFEYDVEGQLRRMAIPGQPQFLETFSYDPAGNRIAGPGLDTLINEVNQVLSEGGRRYRYDERGNMIERDGRKLEYDSRNQLIAAEGLNGERVTFGYDAFGRRTWKKAEPPPDVTGSRLWPRPSAEMTTRRITRYLWAGEQLIREITEEETSWGGRCSTRLDFLYHPDTLAPIGVRIDGRVFFYHNDARGAPQRLTDENGRIVWEAAYQAFGQVQSRVDDVTQPLRLPGQYADGETGLYYNRFRYYDPALGRYTSRDPASYLGGLNLYSYCANDPVNGIDRYGLWSWRSVAVGVVVGVVVAAVAVVAAPALIAAAGVTAASAAGIAISAGVIVTAGAVAGATTAGINSYLDNGHVCWPCVWKGAGIGALASLPFLAVLCPPVAALVGWQAIAAFGGLGFLSGNIGYFAGMDHFNWPDYLATVGLSTVTAGALRAILGPQTARLSQDAQVNPNAPPSLPLNRSIGGNVEQQMQLQADIEAARVDGASDFRVNQQQVNADGVRVGQNRPDLQYTNANGERVYVEYDTPTSGRGSAHADRILANDPDGKVYLKIVPEDGTPTTTRTETDPLYPVTSTGSDEEHSKEE